MDKNLNEQSKATQQALAAITDRLALTYRICCGTAPKQSVGELLDVTIKMPEWEIVRAALTRQAAPEAPTKDRLTPQSLDLLRKGLRDWETPENRYAAQRVLDAIEAVPATRQAGAAVAVADPCDACTGRCADCPYDEDRATPAATTASAPVPHHVACPQRGYNPLCKGCEAEREATTASASWEPLSNAEFLSKRLRRVAKLTGAHIPEHFSHEQVAEVAGTILGEIARALELRAAHAANAGEDTELADVLNTTLWLYRRLPPAYGNPPFVDKAILKMAERLGLDDVPEAIKERVAIAASAAEQKGPQ
jgi:hypothetical protein